MTRSALLVSLLLLGSCQEAVPKVAAGESSPTKILTRNRRFTYRVRTYAPRAGVPLLDTLTLTALDESWAADSTQMVIVYTHALDTTLTSPRPKEIVGAFETKEKYLLHPPRYAHYGLLELSPFPSITFPAVVGNTWAFTIYPDDFYASPSWAIWEGVLPVTFRYRYLADTTLVTPLGPLRCQHVRGRGSSKVGTTALDSYFHTTYGFVRLLYHNINQTRLEMDMLQVDTQPEDYRRNRRVVQALMEKTFPTTW